MLFKNIEDEVWKLKNTQGVIWDRQEEIISSINAIQNYILIAFGIIIILSIIIIWMIWNQHKLKKQLRQLQEMLKEKEVTSSGDQTATDETNQKS